MAKGTVIKKNDSYGKEEQRRKSEAKLSQKLQADLESTILRLFRNSEFCDLELIVESDSILTHSCILQARVSRFYKFLIDECQVFHKNGFSSVFIYNASFVSIRNFVENIYINVELSKIEECMLQNLLGGKSEENRRTETPEHPVKKSLIALTPEADLFYTPQCSPSDIQKTFDQSASAPYSPIKRKDNDITCYYKIVSVDDIPIDEKTDQPEKAKDFIISNDGEHLEKELAEQDELFLSFKSIFSKVDKSTQNAGSYVTKKKGGLRPTRKLEPNASLANECAKPKAKLPLWRPNPTAKETGGSQVDKPNSPRNSAKKSAVVHLPKKLENSFTSASQGVKNRADHSEMDLSATGADSGLENSSSCQPEISPRENTSETSGIDLTDSTANEEIPHDEETVSTKAAEYINSSSSSDMETWDANDENRMEYVDQENKAPILDSKGPFFNHASITDSKEENGLFRETLNEDEVARLDEMEKNIKECETFLNKEREIFYRFDNAVTAHSDSKVSLKVGRGFDETKSAFETVQGSPEENIASEHINKLSVDPEAEDNSYERKSRGPFSDDEINSNNIDNGRVYDIDVISRNLINSETKVDNYSLFKQNNFSECCKEEVTFSNNNFTSLKERECDPTVHSKDPPHMKTPPCSPKQTNKLYEEEEEEEDEEGSDRCRTICKLSNELYAEELDAGKKPDLNFPEVKSNYQYSNSIIPTVNNFFIDASSLLDEDEIISPPVSLLNFKTNKELDFRKGESDEASIRNDENRPVQEERSECDKIQQIQDEERRQGDLIFKNSIPCFSRHEIEKTMERLRGGADSSRENWYDDNEQVVPSSDFQENDSNYTHELNNVNETRPIENYLDFSVPFHIIQDLESSRDEVPDGAKEECADNVVRRIDAESLPIVSGGALPEDFSNSSSHISSPHLRRRNESAPILSGGMDYIEDEKKVQRKPNINHSAAWTVCFDDDEKVRKRRLSSATTISESNVVSLEPECNAVRAEESKEVDSNAEDINMCKTVNKSCSNEAKESCTEKNYRKLPNPIEKSASLGYFIEFPKETYANGGEEEKEKNKMKENTRKNIFSMFIDMKDDKEQCPETVPTFERQNTYDKESEVQEEAVKKPFYMFIESDSPSVKRKTNLPVVQKKLLKNSEEKLDSLVNAVEVRRKTNSEFEDRTCNKNLTGSSQSLNSNDGYYAERESKCGQQTRYSKLPLPLCKSSSLSAVNGEAKMVVWSEKKELKSESSLPEETWLKTNDVLVTYKGKKEGAKDMLFDGRGFHSAKGPGIVPGEPVGIYRKRESRMPGNARSGFHLRTLDEVKSPFKSPEERDSKVIVTEESDDGFVTLSDMDNYKNPYLETNGKKKQISAMSKSIPESGWIENKTFVKSEDLESSMSKSVGVGVVESKSGTTFAGERNFSHSLSRLFPNLNLPSAFVRKTNNSSVNPIGKQDTDPSDTQTSEVSEMSSMQSSVEPSLLETSTSVTDVSCPNGTSRLGEDLLRMFLEEISPDVIVEVEERRIKAHKCVLSSRCQYFAARLSGGSVESAGNVISLDGFSYNSVHFALCHIYSGENRIPDSLDIKELANLADILCLEGLQEVISHNLKVKYCHCFHPPCDVCHAGVLECLPVASSYRLDDLYRKCLHWINKYFVRIWPSNPFAFLPNELLDKCYQHQVVHMTVENVLDTILNIDTVRGSLSEVNRSRTISRLVTKLHDAAVKYIADHFSSIFTSDSFLALGKEAGESVGRLKETLIKAAKSLPPEQACWSHARLHRIVTVAKGPNPPSEMEWNENFIDLLQCISGHVEDSLIKQAPRAVKSKAWRQMEPELRSKIQERACLVLPDDAQSPRPKRSGPTKREPRQSNTASSTAQSNSRTLEIRHMKLAMAQQMNRTSSTSRLQHSDQRSNSNEPRSLKAIQAPAAPRKTEKFSVNTKKTSTGIPETKKFTPSRFMDVKSRYLEPRSPQKIVQTKPSNASNVRKMTKPFSSSDSSRNCSPLNANKGGGMSNARQHRDSVVSNEPGTSCDTRRSRSYASTRSETPSAKTLSRLTADDNMPTDSPFPDSLRVEKDATTRKPEEKSKGKENMRKASAKSVPGNTAPAKSSNVSTTGRKYNNENSASPLYKLPSVNKKYIASSTDPKIIPQKKFTASRVANVNQRAGPGRASLAAPRNNVTNRYSIQKNLIKYDANVINGNAVKNRNEFDADNNENNGKDDKRPSTVSRSGTFLKDEPTVLKKPQPENIESSF